MEETPMTDYDGFPGEEKLKPPLSRRVVDTVSKDLGKARDAIVSGVTTAMWKTGKHTQVTRAVVSGVTTAMWETGKRAQVTRLKMKLPKPQHDLQKLHTALGEVVSAHVKQEKEDVLNQEDVIGLIDRLAKCEAHIAQIEAEIAELMAEAEQEEPEVVEMEGMDLEALSGLARGGSDEQRYDAISMLVQRGDEGTLPVLGATLGDKDPRVRLSVLRGLYRLQTKESMRFLLHALKDAHPDVRASAAAYLGWSGDAAFGDDIVPLLRDDNAQVRKSAAIALGNLASQSAVEPLMDPLGNPDIGVRQQAVIALRRITHQFFNFRAGAPEEERDGAIARWRSWWASGQSQEAPPEKPPVSAPSVSVEEEEEVPPASEAEASDAPAQDIAQWKSWWTDYQATREEPPETEEPPESIGAESIAPPDKEGQEAGTRSPSVAEGGGEGVLSSERIPEEAEAPAKADVGSPEESGDATRE